MDRITVATTSSTTATVVKPITLSIIELHSELPVALNVLGRQCGGQKRALEAGLDRLEPEALRRYRIALRDVRA